MPKPDKHTANEKRPKDINQLAHYLVQKSTEEPAGKESPDAGRSPISEYLAEIGRKGGLKGGKARAERLSKRKRIEMVSIP
jgi:hypothetical protein